MANKRKPGTGLLAVRRRLGENVTGFFCERRGPLRVVARPTTRSSAMQPQNRIRYSAINAATTSCRRVRHLLFSPAPSAAPPKGRGSGDGEPSASDRTPHGGARLAGPQRGKTARLAQPHHTTPPHVFFPQNARRNFGRFFASGREAACCRGLPLSGMPSKKIREMSRRDSTTLEQRGSHRDRRPRSLAGPLPQPTAGGGFASSRLLGAHRFQTARFTSLPARRL